MPVLNGYARSVPMASGGTVQVAGPPQTGTTVAIIDGTPVRVVTMALAAAIGLAALKWAGFKFNVGVS
jgi:hypothetical protein